MVRGLGCCVCLDGGGAGGGGSEALGAAAGEIGGVGAASG
jgi:hypothetical protein